MRERIKLLIRRIKGGEPRTYDPKEFWSKRLEGNLNLSGVGFTDFGESYNECLYKMRRIVLERAISKCKINVPNMRILDIGCGSGFYVDIWHNLGATDLVGLDITNASVRFLSAQYPELNFYEADITSPTLFNDLSSLRERFDLITVFDVLFHIVDDDKFEQAIKNIQMLCSQDGYIFITDLFPHKRPYIIFCQKSRLLRDYVRVLEHNGIEITDRFPVHYLMNAPLDISNGLLQKILLHFWWAQIVRIVERSTHLLGPIFARLDSVLTRLLRESPSTEMIICKLKK